MAERLRLTEQHDVFPDLRVRSNTPQLRLNEIVLAMIDATTAEA